MNEKKPSRAFCSVRSHSFLGLLYFCADLDVFFMVKVTSSTCPPSSKTAGSSSGRNMECSSYWTQFAFTTGKTTSLTIPLPSPHSCSASFSLHQVSLHQICSSLSFLVLDVKMQIWVRMTSRQSELLSVAFWSITSAREPPMRRSRAFWDTSLPLEMRNRWEEADAGRLTVSHTAVNFQHHYSSLQCHMILQKSS